LWHRGASSTPGGTVTARLPTSTTTKRVPARRDSTATAAPPAAMLAIIWAVTSAGYALTP
jgi:hypothetical protein